MPTESTHIQQILAENEFLKIRLAAAEAWIGREISDRHMRDAKAKTLRMTKAEIYETEAEVLLRIEKYFGPLLTALGSENIDLLIDAEMNYAHLVRKKDLDGFIVSHTYQKILEQIFERVMVGPFRDTYQKKRLSIGKNTLLEKTLYKVLKDNFSLSIGKIYQILENGSRHECEGLMGLFISKVISLPVGAIIDDGQFWDFFHDIIATGAFGEKRHSGKTSFADVTLLRAKILGHFSQPGFLSIILEAIK